MALSRKHYKTIASIFKRRIEEMDKGKARTLLHGQEFAYRKYHYRREEACDIAAHLSLYFTEDNPNFHSKIFMRAAGCLD